MIEMYFNLVINQRRTCNESNNKVTLVPMLYREEVLNLLTSREYDADGNKIN